MLPPDHGIRRRVQRLQLLHPQYVPGVNGIGIADQCFDAGDRQPLRTRIDRRARCGARCRMDRCFWRVQGAGKRGQLLPPGTHPSQTFVAGFTQTGQQVGQADQPAGRNSWRIGIAQRTGDQNVPPCDGLLKIMRGQSDISFWQQQVCLQAHVAVQPRVRRRNARPDAVVHSTKDHDVRPLNAGLQCAPDGDVGMLCNGFTNITRAHDRIEQGAVFLRGQVPARICFCLKFRKCRLRLFSGLLVPKFTGTVFGHCSTGQRFRQLTVLRKTGRQGFFASIFQFRQQSFQPQHPLDRCRIVYAVGGPDK